MPCIPLDIHIQNAQNYLEKESNILYIFNCLFRFPVIKSSLVKKFPIHIAVHYEKIR